MLFTCFIFKIRTGRRSKKKKTISQYSPTISLQDLQPQTPPSALKPHLRAYNTYVQSHAKRTKLWITKQISCYIGYSDWKYVCTKWQLCFKGCGNTPWEICRLHLSISDKVSLKEATLEQCRCNHSVSLGQGAWCQPLERISVSYYAMLWEIPQLDLNKPCFDRTARWYHRD